MVASFPIDKHLNQIRAVLSKESKAVIQAPPGAGKTTRVPPALLHQDWLSDKIILLLEPRRLAAVSCAGYMAESLGETVGQTVGYQIRLERKRGPDTKILVVTEGIFTRMIQHDPALEDVGLVIFDEFHERNIHSDLGLALVMESMDAFRDDLRVLIMSATMNTDMISDLLGNAPVIESKGKTHPVKTFYLPPSDRKGRKMSIVKASAGAVQTTLSRTQGDILVFLPGVGEIMQLKTRLDKWENEHLEIIPLYGSLPVKEQKKIFQKAGPGKRKVVIATAIAETSITIDGIKTVIDSGLMRTMQFSPQTGMSRLVTVPVSRAAADQRRGRSGRTAPGTCYRLWSEYEHSLLKQFSDPEIFRSDLASLMLELAAWGVDDPEDLQWLDNPRQGPVNQAKELLKKLGAVDESGRITAHGKKMARAGLHPRLSHMVLISKKKNKGALGCRLAALLMEKDIIRFNNGASDPDVRFRLELIEKVAAGKTDVGHRQLNKRAVFRLLESERKIAREFKISLTTTDLHDAGELLAHAYPDWIAKQRGTRNLTYLTASGKGICFSQANALSKSDYIVAVHLDGNPKNAKIWLAAPYQHDLLQNDFESAIQKKDILEWDQGAGEVRQMVRTSYKRLVLDEQIQPISRDDQATAVMIRQIKEAGLQRLPWTATLQELRHRTQFLNNTGYYPDLPDLSDAVLTDTMDTWLAPFLSGVYSFSQLKQLTLTSVMSALLPWDKQRIIDSDAPTHITVPSGTKKRLQYHDRKGVLSSPVLQVRLQEMFGLTRTPMVAENRVPVTVHLLSPANRAVQITTDLKSFWDNTYQEVKKDLKGRYPKHYWPDDPYSATPTSRVKPR